MGISYNPSVVGDGLVFYYDMANTQKSWKGAPTTNLLSGNLSDFGDIYLNSTKTIINANEVRFVNNGIAASTVRMYVNLENLVNGSTYGVSVYAKNVIGNINFDWCDTTITGGVTSLNSEGRLYGLGTRATYDSTFRFLDVDIGIGGAVTLYNAQVDSIPIVTSYILPTTTRSNTQVILDLIGNNTLTSSSLTYNANNTFSFDGNNNFAQTTSNCAITSSVTLSAFIKPSYSGQTGPHSTIICTDAGYPYGAKLMNYKNASRYGIWLGFGGTDNFEAFVATDINDNINKMITASWNQTTGIAKIYLNGILTSSISTGKTIPTVLLDGKITVGTDYNSIGSANKNKFLGNIYTASVYNKALSDTEVYNNFIALKSRYGL